MSDNAAGLQNCTRSLDEMNTTGLNHSQGHHHLHHLKPEPRQTTEADCRVGAFKRHLKRHQPHLNLSVRLASTSVTSVLDEILQELSCRGRPEHRGVFLLLENARLVADGDAVAVEIF